jgi:exocyst complex component 4
VLDRIKDDWEFVIDPDVRFRFYSCEGYCKCNDMFFQFNPVDLALHILDDSSAGKDIESFRRTKRMLSAALQGSVDSMSHHLPV